MGSDILPSCGSREWIYSYSIIQVEMIKYPVGFFLFFFTPAAVSTVCPKHSTALCYFIRILETYKEVFTWIDCPECWLTEKNGTRHNQEWVTF